MKNGFLHSATMMMGVVVFAVGCSEVDFGPAPDVTEVGRQATTPAPGDTGPSPLPPNPSGPQWITETYTQTAEQRKVDIVVVVDNSLSMTEEQNKMAQRMSSFFRYLKGSGWRIAVTTTDVSDGPYGLKGEFLPVPGLGKRFLEPSDANYQELFKQMVVRKETAGEDGNYPSGNEEPLRASILAMAKKSIVNAGFFRDDADLGLLVLSDEDERSNGGPAATKGQAVLDAFHSHWPNGKDLYAYGIIIEPGDTDCYASQSGYDGQYGHVISNFVTMTYGITGSICDEDYGMTLGRIGDRMTRLLAARYLQKLPVKTSVEVVLIPEQPEVKWSVVGQRVIFDVPPKLGTVVGIRYQAQ